MPAKKKLDRFAGEFGAFHHIQEILFVDVKNSGGGKRNTKKREKQRDETR